VLSSKITSSKRLKSVPRDKLIDVSSPLCTIATMKFNQSAGTETWCLWLLAESSLICLEDEILNRVNKKSFEEIEIWSVLSSCVLGAITLLEKGCKEPVLSPKGIGLSRDGIIKVGEWELVANPSQGCLQEEGEVILGKFGHQTTEFHKNSLNELLLNYYWAPEGLRAIENLMALGGKEPQSMSHQGGHNSYFYCESSQKFQIFSLGMSLISMCLRGCFYRTDTFS
jgi:hypothetical protein